MVARNYLLETGRIFWVYMVGLWIISLGACLFGLVLGYRVYTTFT